MLPILNNVIEDLNKAYKGISRENAGNSRLSIVKRLIGAALMSATAARDDLQSKGEK